MVKFLLSFYNFDCQQSIYHLLSVDFVSSALLSISLLPVDLTGVFTLVRCPAESWRSYLFRKQLFSCQGAGKRFPLAYSEFRGGEIQPSMENLCPLGAYFYFVSTGHEVRSTCGPVGQKLLYNFCAIGAEVPTRWVGSCLFNW